MASDRTLLLMGTSALYYSETSPEHSLASLVARELSARGSGVDWRCANDFLYQGPTMARRASTLVERHEPDVVVVYLSSLQFVYERSVNRVRQRWPWLFDWRTSVAERTARLSGMDEFQPPASLRGRLFGAPRFLARTLVPGTTELGVEAAADYTMEALGVLLTREDLEVVCRLPTINGPPPATKAARYRGRLAEFNATVGEYCGRHHVDCFDLPRELEAAGQELTPAADGFHMSDACRRFEAKLIARRVLAASLTASVPDATA
jgi:hypothetical protein